MTTGVVLVEQALEKLSDDELKELMEACPRSLKTVIRKILYTRHRTTEKPLELHYDIISIDNDVVTIVTDLGKILTVPLQQLNDYDFIMNI